MLLEALLEQFSQSLTVYARRAVAYGFEARQPFDASELYEPSLLPEFVRRRTLLKRYFGQSGGLEVPQQFLAANLAIRSALLWTPDQEDPGSPQFQAKVNQVSSIVHLCMDRVAAAYATAAHADAAQPDFTAFFPQQFCPQLAQCLTGKLVDRQPPFPPMLGYPLAAVLILPQSLEGAIISSGGAYINRYAPLVNSNWVSYILRHLDSLQVPASYRLVGAF